MRCYYHQDREAVGFCKSCNKGLCPHCLIDLGKGMACKGRCEADVRDLIAMTEVSVTVTAKVPNQLRANRLQYFLMSWFLLGAGAVFFLLGVLDYPRANFLFLMSGLFLFFGLLVMIFVSRMPRFDTREKDDPSQELGEG